MPRFWRVILAATCFIVLGALLWQSPPKSLQHLLETSAQIPEYPSAYITGAKTRQFGEQGELSYLLKTRMLRIYESNDTESYSNFDDPHITLYSENTEASPWVITSLKGNSTADNETIVLTGNVYARQTLSDGTLSRLTTESLTIKPRSRFAETNKPVIITSGNDKTKATGAKIFLDGERIELLSNVESQYVPN